MRDLHCLGNIGGGDSGILSTSKEYVPTMTALFNLEPLSTDNLVTIILAVIGFGGTIFSIVRASRQLRESRRVTQGQFLLELSDHFRNFEGIHRSLLRTKKGAIWAPPDDDWTSVVFYMGLFERCQVLLEDEALVLDEFERLYGYRLRLLVNRGSVRDRYFSNASEALGWQDFIRIWKQLDDAYAARTNQGPQNPAPVHLLQANASRKPQDNGDTLTSDAGREGSN